MTTVSNLAANISTTNGASLGSFTVPDGGMIAVSIAAAWSSLSVGSSFTCAFTGTMGLTWSKLRSEDNVSSRRALGVFYAVNTTGSAVTGTIIATLSNTGGAGYQEHIYSVDLYAAIDSADPIASSTSTQGSAGTVLTGGAALSVPGGGDISVLAGMHTSAATVISLGSELTNQLSQTGGGGNVRRMIVAYDSAPDSTPLPTATFTPADDWACITFLVNNGTGGIGGGGGSIAPGHRALLGIY